MEQGRAVPEGLNEGSLARIAWNSGNSGSRPVGYGMIGTPSGGCSLRNKSVGLTATALRPESRARRAVPERCSEEPGTASTGLLREPAR
jgi:hypothetical protein